MDRDDELALKIHLNDSSESDEFTDISSATKIALVKPPVIKIDPNMCVKIPANSEQVQQNETQNKHVIYLNAAQSYAFVSNTKSKRTRKRGKKKLFLDENKVPQTSTSKIPNYWKERRKGKNEKLKQSLDKELGMQSSDFSKNIQMSSRNLELERKKNNNFNNKKSKKNNIEYGMENLSKFLFSSSSNIHESIASVNIRNNLSVLSPSSQIAKRGKNKPKKPGFNVTTPIKQPNTSKVINHKVQTKNQHRQEKVSSKGSRSTNGNINTAATSKQFKQFAVTPSKKQKLNTATITNQTKRTTGRNKSATTSNTTGTASSKTTKTASSQQNKLNKQVPSNQKTKTSKIKQANNLPAPSKEKKIKQFEVPHFNMSKKYITEADTKELLEIKKAITDRIKECEQFEAEYLSKNNECKVETKEVQAKEKMFTEINLKKNKSMEAVCNEENKQTKPLNTLKCKTESDLKHFKAMAAEYPEKSTRVSVDDISKFFNNQIYNLRDSSVDCQISAGDNLSKNDQKMNFKFKNPEGSSKACTITAERIFENSFSGDAPVSNIEDALINLWGGDTLQTTNSVDQASTNISRSILDEEIVIDNDSEKQKTPIRYCYSKESLLKIKDSMSADDNSATVDSDIKIPDVLLKNVRKAEACNKPKKKKKTSLQNSVTDKSTQTDILIPVDENKWHLYFEDFKFRNEDEIVESTDNKKRSFQEYLVNNSMTLLYIYLFVMFLINGIWPILVFIFNVCFILLFVISIYKCFV